MMKLNRKVATDLLEALNSKKAISNERWSLEKTQCKWNELYEQWRECSGEWRANITDLIVAIEDRHIEVAHLDTTLHIRIFSPKKNQCIGLKPALLWFHGGGYIGGNLDYDDNLCASIADNCDCIIVAVDYRLAPQHPYPAALNDNYAALLWLCSKTALEIGVDTNRIAIGGMSAGAGLAAGLAMYVRDNNGPSIAFQVLMIPALDDRHQTASSYEVDDVRVWNRALSKRAWKAYLDGQTTSIPVYAAPGRAEDLSNLPPAFVSIEEHDILRDEGKLYADRLMKAGVQTQCKFYPNTYHGSVMDNPSAVSSVKHLVDVYEYICSQLKSIAKTELGNGVL